MSRAPSLAYVSALLGGPGSCAGGCGRAPVPRLASPKLLRLFQV